MNRIVSSLTLVAVLLAGCGVSPDYHRPQTALPASFKEAPGWRPAQPADAVARGEWWLLLNDPVLDALERRVLVSNQNLAASAAAYAQARALVRETRAGLFPVVDLSARATKTGVINSTGGTTIIAGGSSGGAAVSSSGGGTTTRYNASIGATWEPDIWGRIGASVSQAGAQAQASQADLANATLSAQGELALNYVQLRAIEAQKRALDETVAAYQRNAKITANRYDAGIVARVDVLQAETQLRNARATAADLGRQRALLEHAIAVLVGENPSTFTLAVDPQWRPTVPEAPAVLPSQLLERRPDIAAAERRVAAANAGIGIERSAFFPTIGLTGDIGPNTGSLSQLFSLSNTIWSLGVTGALTLLDFGARASRVAQARAAYDQQVATYRQAVLTAFQQTEDQLAASRILTEVGAERTAAAVAANRVEQLTQNQYLAGQIAYSDVIVAQATALSARQTAITATLDRQTAAISLIQAIGGSWAGGDR